MELYVAAVSYDYLHYLCTADTNVATPQPIRALFDTVIVFLSSLPASELPKEG